MNRDPVKSSNLKSVGHEGDVMEVEFTSGTVYRYAGVSPELYAEFQKAESKGRFFAQKIRPLPATRVEPEKTEEAAREAQA